MSQNERTPQNWLSRLLSFFRKPAAAVPRCPLCGSDKLIRQGYEDRWMCGKCHQIVVPEVKK